LAHSSPELVFTQMKPPEHCDPSLQGVPCVPLPAKTQRVL
jgi:hypothetical protein